MKRIVTVGFDLAAPHLEHAPLDSKISLLDWDIILFKPEINEFYSYGDSSYQGKRCLSDDGSFRLKECCEHWRRELKQAVETGKTVLVFLAALEEVFVDTGQRSYSGTGRNRSTTRHVAEYNNYEAVPATLAPVTATGKAMKLSPRGAEVLAPYWSEFESVSNYRVVLTNSKVPTCIVTRTGAKAVGALYRSKASPGTLVLLPDIDFYREDLVATNDDGTQSWTPDGEQFGSRMVAAVVALDATLRAGGEITPAPVWAGGDAFVLEAESRLRVELLKAERQVEDAQRRKELIAEDLRAVGAHRALLFEKGKPLENAIIEALTLLGFSAAPFEDSDSEFDVVFESEEGRLIGEAEGKDNKAVNIDKLRQLAMNIHEDLQRETTDSPAKPVLFGNGFRLQPLDQRGDSFTEKCKKAAATSSTALVFTPDLFFVVQYLLGTPDAEYAKKCRNALLSSTGRVAFPTLPEGEKKHHEMQVEKTSDEPA